MTQESLIFKGLFFIIKCVFCFINEEAQWKKAATIPLSHETKGLVGFKCILFFKQNYDHTTSIILCFP